MTKKPLNTSGGQNPRGRGRLQPAVGPVRGVAVLVVLALAGSASSIAASAGAGKKPALRYNHDIRPILSDNCFFCHGPDKNKRKAKLRLDVREAAVEKEAIIPSHPEQSQLIKRIYTTDTDDVMPPPETHKVLTSEQKELLARWIAEGAEYEPHWAYVKPTRPAVPRTKGPARNPIDAFILHTLEAKGIQPSPEADKHTLLRRLSLDLIGLPPTPEEMEAFLNDSSSNAYQRQVDRLLRSPHFGERMAVPWLDLARFSDTVGYHGDQNVNVFPYRDYVIDSFNQNKPFDQFTLEQLAGDLLPHPTTEQLIATGFNRLNMVTREGGAQPKEYLAKYAADRVRTISSTWLGSTMGCCECHDHKFDPFSTKDFYSMEAFFADIKQWGVYQDYGYTPNPDLKGWSNDHPFPPEITVESPYLHRRIERLERRIAELELASAAQRKTNAQQRAAFDKWQRWSVRFLKQWTNGWAVPSPSVTVRSKETNAAPESYFTVEPGGTILFKGKTAESTEIRLPLSPGWLAALRLELIPRPEHNGNNLFGSDETTTLTLSASLNSEAEAKSKRLAFFHADADYKEERYTNGFAVVGVRDAWRISREHRKSPQTAVWLLDKPLQVNPGDTLLLTLGKNTAGCLRVALSPFAARDALKSGGGEPLRKALSNLSRGGGDWVNDIYLLSTAWDPDAFAQCRKLCRQSLEFRGGKSPTVVTVAWNPMVTRVLPRGNWQDESGEIVKPAVPHFLPQVSAPGKERLTRLDLARWLVSPDNPLTARTVMNRLWKQFFGTGISAVVDDLGAQGEWPVHPELLDWLAVEFMDSGWNIKHMVKQIVLSSTYRQSSNARPEHKEIDPANRLLASQSPRRLEAELVRDNALFIAGLLNPDIGGPSSHPYQPAGYYVNLQFPDRDYFPERDERQYRRGVYMHWQRTFLHPMLASFDAPSREECVASRNVSNTPQQALTLLNDPSLVEASRAFAERVLAKRSSDDARLDLACKEALARPIKPKEQKSLEEFLALQREHYRSNPDEAKKLLRVGLAPEPIVADDPELAAWTQVCRVMLNLQETITRY